MARSEGERLTATYLCTNVHKENAGTEVSSIGVAVTDEGEGGIAVWLPGLRPFSNIAVSSTWNGAARASLAVAGHKHTWKKRKIKTNAY